MYVAIIFVCHVIKVFVWHKFWRRSIVTLFHWFKNDYGNGWESNSACKSNPPSNESSDEGFEIVQFEMTDSRWRHLTIVAGFNCFCIWYYFQICFIRKYFPPLEYSLLSDRCSIQLKFSGKIQNILWLRNSFPTKLMVHETLSIITLKFF